MSAKKQRTRRFRLRFYLILLVPILLVGAYIGYRILRPTTGRLGTDTVEGDMEFTGVIIRRENVAPSEDYHTIRYLVSEGDMVSGSQQVAYLYRKGYENQMSDIVSKEQQIYQQQITLLRLSSSDGMTVPDEVSDYNSRIEEVVNKMTQASLGKDGLDYIRLSEELDDLLTARQNLLRQIVPTDATLTASYQQLDALRSAFSAESILVNNSGNGYISFHLDGYENAMSIDSLTESQEHSRSLEWMTRKTLSQLEEGEGYKLDFTLKKIADRFNSEEYRIALEKAGLEGVKMMLVNYPNMPTGQTPSMELFEKIES